MKGERKGKKERGKKGKEENRKGGKKERGKKGKGKIEREKRNTRKKGYGLCRTETEEQSKEGKLCIIITRCVDFQ